MAFLKINGKPLSWEESKKYFQHIRKQAVKQIITWMSKMTRSCSGPRFGYEFEFHKVFIDHKNQLVQIDLSGQEDVFVDKRNLKENNPLFVFQPEFGKWMIECVPNGPFNFNEVHKVEISYENLWKFLKERLAEKDFLAMGSFPMLGVGDFIKDSENELMAEGYYHSSTLKENPFMKSMFVPDKCFNSHPRFGTLAKNIRERRGSNVEIKVPIFPDLKTNLTEKTETEPFPGYIYMDCMAFGMGNICHQITIGFCSLNLSKFGYDLFVPICPIVLALTASTPIFKGKLAGHDTRFEVLSQAVDDRTPEERDPNHKDYVYKPRYGNVLSYLSEHIYVQDHYNDTQKFKIDQEDYETLLKAGIPKRLATHFCNLMTRDPLVIFDEKIDIVNSDDYSHFENFQSTNWNSLRLKPPRIEDEDYCYKVEFRVAEINLTPFENAAVTSFVILFAKMIYQYDFNTIIPLSKVDENMKRASSNDAILKEKFWFRTNGLSVNPSDFRGICEKASEENKLSFSLEKLKVISEKNYDDEIHELTVNEILCGSEKFNYPGLFWMMEDYIQLHVTDDRERQNFKLHLEFLRKRSTGEIMTDASYIRNFVLNHKDYKQDSIVSEKISYDLVNHLMDIQHMRIRPKELFGN